jgi:hypothetical protein
MWLLLVWLKASLRRYGQAATRAQLRPGGRQRIVTSWAFSGQPGATMGASLPVGLDLLLAGLALAYEVLIDVMLLQRGERLISLTCWVVLSLVVTHLRPPERAIYL